MQSTKPLDNLVTEIPWTRYQLTHVGTSEDDSLLLAVHDPSTFDVTMLGEIVHIHLSLCLRAALRLPFGPIAAFLLEREIPEALLADVPSYEFTAEERSGLRFLRLIDRDGRPMLAAVVAEGYTRRNTDARAY